ERALKYEVPPRTPFVGSEFNVTRAGIHADGLLKSEEIYNSFDTRKILGRPAVVAVNSYSGMAGIAAWINGYFDLDSGEKIDKKDRRLLPIKNWIDNEYENGRTSNIRNDELKELTLKYIPNILENEDTKAI
ncbi:2-isopropylmalate synthase, partial [Clostridium sp. cpc1]|nr:2-isopropylmalate synthase [Clostridium sp. cpc1]